MFLALNRTCISFVFVDRLLLPRLCCALVEIVVDRHSPGRRRGRRRQISGRHHPGQAFRNVVWRPLKLSAIDGSHRLDERHGSADQRAG